MSPVPARDSMEEIRRDVREIKIHMTDHDLLIRVSTLLESMSPKMDSIEKLAALKADGSDLKELAALVEKLTLRVDGLQGYMNRMIGMGLAVQVFITIILGLISLIRR